MTNALKFEIKFKLTMIIYLYIIGKESVAIRITDVV